MVPKKEKQIKIQKLEATLVLMEQKFHGDASFSQKWYNTTEFTYEGKRLYNTSIFPISSEDTFFNAMSQGKVSPQKPDTCFQDSEVCITDVFPMAEINRWLTPET